MTTKRQRLSWVIAAALTAAHGLAAAETIEKSIGRSAAHVGEGVGDVMRDSYYRNMPEWIDVKPRSKEDCFKESGGMINPVFMKCRNGYQQRVVRLSDGSQKVLGERPLQ